MKNLAFQILFIVLFIGKVQSQNNALRIFYAPAASKFKHKDYPPDFSFDELTYLPNKAFIGNLMGIEYSRTIKNISVSVGYRYSLKGAKPPYFYEKRYRLSADYVGSMYDFRFYSNEFFLTASTRLFPKRKNWNLSVGIGVSADVVRIAEISEVYVIPKEYGVVRLGGSLGGFLESNTLKNIKKNINMKNYSVGVSALVGIDIKLMPHFYLNLQPELEYLTKLGTPSSFTHFWVFALQTGIKFKF